MKEKHDVVEPEGAGEVIRLEDLAPRKDVKGGSGQVVFGEGLDAAWEENAASRRFEGTEPNRPRRRP